jgi:hypothetical protein
MAVSVEPVTVETGVVLAFLLDATADADEGTDVLKIDCAGVFYGYYDSTRSVRITPHFVAVDSDKPMMEFVRSIVHEADVADDDAPRSVDVDVPEGFNSKAGKPIAVECTVHPISFGDKESAIVRLNDTGGHVGSITVLGHTGCLL